MKIDTVKSKGFYSSNKLNILICLYIFKTQVIHYSLLRSDLRKNYIYYKIKTLVVNWQTAYYLQNQKVYYDCGVKTDYKVKKQQVEHVTTKGVFLI